MTKPTRPASSSRRVHRISVWRDSAGHEVDFLLDLGTALVPIEVKSGETVAPDSLKGIDFWRSLAGQADAPAALVYGGESSYVRRGVSVTSWMDWA